MTTQLPVPPPPTPDVVPPDDPNYDRTGRDPNIDPPPTDPGVVDPDGRDRERRLAEPHEEPATPSPALPGPDGDPGDQDIDTAGTEADPLPLDVPVRR